MVFIFTIILKNYLLFFDFFLIFIHKVVYMSKKLELSEEKIKELKSFYYSGLSIKSISKKVRISQGVIAKYFKLDGVKLRYPIVLTNSQKEELKNLYSNGVSIIKISKITNIGQGIITKYFKSNEIKIRHQVNITKEQEKEIIEIYKNSDMTVNKLAENFNMSHSGMIKVLKRNNIKRDKIINTPQNIKLKEQIIDLYVHKKMFPQEIKNQLNIPISFINFSLKQNNINSHRKEFSKDVELKILKLCGNSVPSVSEIVNILPICEKSVKKILKKHNIEIKNKGISIEVKNKIINLYVNEKKYIPEIAKYLNISNSSVRDFLIENNIEITGKKKSKEIENRIIELYKDSTISSREVAEILSINAGTVIKILRKHGIEIRPLKTSDELELKIIDLYVNSYLSSTEIGNNLNISKVTVLSILRRRKIKTRDKSQALLGLNDEDYKKHLESIPENIKYRKEVNSITKKQPLIKLENYEKRGNYKQVDSYNLDHKYSVMEGFRNNIEPKIIGHIANLEMLPYKENISKSDKCSITLEELITKISQYESIKNQTS